ncbi:uncharacterized protein LOC112588334 [Harpegnathos saltator]|uniref:uncharacterized protein LOC112588334 n=1 Tax=Harpegnathos saltator TaxID=610380 RepID=UPI000DBECFD0|nr:uncharacterized protein LOC112588334 [Harpegnathos saltator]
MGRLMLNVGGPGWKARRLHAGVLNSVALYGAPIWTQALAVSRPMQTQLRKAHRALTVRVARCYRTVSHMAATDLAGMPPPRELLALMYRTMYVRKRELLHRGGGVRESLAGALRRMKHQARQLLLQRWQRILAGTKYGRRTVEAVQPCLEEWVGRDFGILTFRMAQVLTGYGCFGKYLCQIGKERTTQCHHCGNDSAQHTLQDYPAWSAERGVVIREIGRDLSLLTIVRAIVGSKRK